MKNSISAFILIACLPFTAMATMVDFTSSESTYITSFSSGADMNFDGQLLNVDEGSGTTRSLIGFSGLFGNGAGQVPLGSNITQALLTVKVADIANAESIDTINVHQVLTAWDQTTVTWNIFNMGGVAGTDYVATPAGSFNPVSRDTEYTVNITSIVQNWSSGAPNLGVILISDGTDGLRLHDDSSVGMGPKLSVTAVPEPTPILMIGLIGMVFGGCRWWKSRRNAN